ncbi:ABC transporter permease [Lysinibacillus pakistanensis]|uniref:ABC transporter permease n=1 Tax=Lysinibacillus pakistanensis TaxID=759811 RepID=A0AAX3WSG7_9BACI|nr:ABC transporter permease [Lysinibacillus pakistanensis]AVK84510.1 ABC transporter permease [Lysinibacillus sp. B2A1]MDM5234307.1 ABC transporter permease [Lysinibacillus pakistanensis]WHY44896.1 ABC transporter permease [Lysinibacillus pakistanensis]WHY49903.1 ABC transporter permease [Lysinibacillus pakistanensis]
MTLYLWAERLKLKRSNIFKIAIFSTIIVAVIVFMQGQFIYYGERYIDEPEWYLTAIQSLGSFYVFPAIIALMGTYIICREIQDDTLKSLVLIPVSISKMLIAKLLMTAFYSLLLYGFVFLIALTVELSLHFSLLNLNTILNNFKMYLLTGIGFFLAVSPIITLVYKLKGSHWLALIFAEVFAFLGLFASMQSTLRAIYPITAVFNISGYYEATSSEIILSLISLILCGTVSILFIMRFNKNSSKV